MASNNILGEFLRARREATNPIQVGLLYSGPRRTPGLRREEVAMFAGVSTDYYIRLEQGRERHPSEQVLGALARALDLEPAAAAHLHELAHPRPPQLRAVEQTEKVSPDLLRLIHGWPFTPALVINRWMDVLARNPLAAALFDGQEHADNLVRMVFLNPAVREIHRDLGRDWEQLAHAKVAHLRAAVGTDLDDPHLAELVDELSLKNADFHRLWVRHDVSRVSPIIALFRHRDVGDLILTCEAFTVNSAPGQQLITIHAEPASPSELALTLLGSSVMGHDHEKHLYRRLKTA
ncbi:helix-turn-helix transcriptional regulator [Streptosporangium sp. NPDC000396]|uniref:helix-turn-helix transcriptional regulator n=1 Tax=Streptosporangium sp. NPDC000396 TaxID=3366185 RepID=UPI00367928AD